MAIRDNLLTAAQKSGYMLEDKIDLSEYYLNEFNMPRYYFEVQKDGIIVINTNSDIIEETETYIAATVQDNGENIGYRFTPNTKYDTRTIEVFKDQVFSLSTHKTSDHTYIDHQFDWIYFYPYKASGSGVSSSVDNMLPVMPEVNTGLSSTSIKLLLTILRNCATYSNQSSNIDALEIALKNSQSNDGGNDSGNDGGNDSGEGTTTNGVYQTNSILTIVSGVTATKNGSVLSIT